MKLIPRPDYVNRVFKLRNRGMMLFLIGQRRVGKSRLLRLIKTQLESERPDNNVIFIDKESMDFDLITDAFALNQYVDQQLVEGKDNYLLIDEVQDIEEYENCLRSLHGAEKCQIIATGSNAYVYSSELATRLSGRYMEIPVRSLSYKEFLTFHNLEDADGSLQKFLEFGGLPGLINFDLDDWSSVADYLSGVYNTIMRKDIEQRASVRNRKFLDRLTWLLADITGKPTSVRNIANAAKAYGEEASEPMVSKYLELLTNAMLITPVNRFDIHGKRLLESNPKYYFNDHGMRNLLSRGHWQSGIEKVMENVVFNHLIYCGFDVTVGSLRAGEVDFIASRGPERMYIQVAYLISAEGTETREFDTLFKLKDNYPKMVVTMNPFLPRWANYEGVRHLHLRDFLSQKW